MIANQMLLLCQRFFAGEVISELIRKSTERDVEDEFFKKNIVTLSHILNLKMNKLKSIDNEEKSIYSRKIIMLYGLELELFAALAEYYEVKCQVDDYEGNRLEDLRILGYIVQEYLVEYEKAFAKTYKRRKYGLFSWKNTGKLVLSKYKNKLEEELMKGAAFNINEPNKDLLTSSISEGENLRLRLAINMIGAVYKYSRAELDKVKDQDRSVILKNMEMQIEKMDKLLDKNQEHLVTELSIEDLVENDGNKVY